MFRCFVLLAAGLLAGAALAGPDDDFVEVYQLIQQTDTQRESGQFKDARAGYERAQEQLRQLQKSYPEWNERVVAYRLRYVAEKLAALPAAAPTLPAVVVPAPAGAAPEAVGPSNEVLTQFNALNTQIAQLRADRQLLEAKLREALTAQPVPIDPKELQAAVDRISQLQSTNKALLTRLETQQAERRNLVDKVLVDEARQALAAANQQLTGQREKTVELERLRNLAEGELKRLREGELKEAKAENATLKSQVTELKSDTERGQQIANLTARLTKLQSGLDEAQRQNVVLVADRAKLEKQIEAMSARQSEEGILRVKQLETDLVIAKAEADRHGARAEELTGLLAKETGARTAAEQDNRKLADRVQALTAQAAGMKALETQLAAEQEERADVEAQLRVAEERLASVRTKPGATGAAETGGPVLDGAADPALLAQIDLLETETGRLREALREGRSRQTELAGLLAEAEKTRGRLEREKLELLKSLAEIQKTPAQQQLARASRTIKSLEEHVRELEQDRDKLAKRLAEATQKSKSNLQLARRARIGNPREDITRSRVGGY